MGEVFNNATAMDNASVYMQNLEESFGPKRDSLYVVVPVTVIYVTICLTGLIGNVSTCVVISRNKSMHTATNYYLFSLAISDLLLLLSGLPQEMYSIWSKYPYVFGQTFCIIRGLCSETAANATVLTITAFTMERYVAICHPFLSHTMSKLNRAIKLILIIWIIAIGCAIPLVLQLEVYPMVPGIPDSVVCYPKNVIVEHAFTISTVVFFIAPMTLITVLYALIGFRLKSSNVMKNNAGGSVRSERNIYTTKRGTSCRHHGQSSRRVLKMLVAVVIAFFICWAPFHVQRLVATYTPRPTTDAEMIKYRKVYNIVTYISGILYYISTTINPLLYNIMSNKFREAFKETFARCCRLAHIKPGRPQQSYSALSRSIQRGPDSTTDSGRDDPSVHTHTSLTHKGSLDSFSGPHPNDRRLNSSKRPLDRYSMREGDRTQQGGNICTSWPKERSQTTLALFTNTAQVEIVPQVRTDRSIHQKSFWRFFRCVAKQNLDKRHSFGSPVKDPSVLLELERNSKMDNLSMSLCEISNSSLKDVENMALEDELSTYMKEIKRRERCN